MGMPTCLGPSQLDPVACWRASENVTEESVETVAEDRFALGEEVPWRLDGWIRPVCPSVKWLLVQRPLVLHFAQYLHVYPSMVFWYHSGSWERGMSVEEGDYSTICFTNLYLGQFGRIWFSSPHQWHFNGFLLIGLENGFGHFGGIPLSRAFEVTVVEPGLG